MSTILLASHWHDHDGWFPLFPLLFLALWVFLIVLLARRWRGGPGRPSAESVLAERYARGEIDEREYVERRAVLRRKH